MDLAKTEQIEVVDQEGAHEHQRPAQPEEPVQDGTNRGVLEGPYGTCHGPPLPAEEEESRLEMST